MLLTLLSTLSTLLAGQNLYINNERTIIDKNTQICYATVKASNDDSLRVSFCYNNSAIIGDAKVCIDGKYYNPVDNMTVLAKRDKHLLIAEYGERKDTLYFVLTTLPLITIDRANNQAFKLESCTPTRFSIYDADARTGQKNIFQSNAKVSYRGATASLMEKKSYKIELVKGESYNEELEANLFSIRKGDSWILDAAAIDYSRIRNRLCTDIWNSMSTLRDDDMKRNGTSGLYVELLVDSAYQGIYCFTDKINRSLLGLKKLKEDANYDSAVRGILYKCKGNGFGTSYLTMPQTEWWAPNTERWFDWFIKYPNDQFDDQCWEPLYNLIEHTNINSSDADSVKAVTDCFYYKNFIEYAVFAMSMQLLDNVMHNTYLSVKNRNNSFQLWITPWDMDGSFGRDGAAVVYDVPASSFHVFFQCHPFAYYYDEQVRPFYDDFCELTQQLHEVGQPLSYDVVSQRIDDYINLLEFSGSWQRECNRWSGMNNVWFNTPIILGASLREEAQFMKEWYKKNEEYLTALKNDMNDIKHIPAPHFDDAHSIYLLNGVRVKATSIHDLPHGIYIVNGKKVIR